MPDLINHLDHGKQFASSNNKQALSDYRIRHSMSRTSDYYDDACNDFSFGNLKSELISGVIDSKHA